MLAILAYLPNTMLEASILYKISLSEPRHLMCGLVHGESVKGVAEWKDMLSGKYNEITCCSINFHTQK